LKINEFCKNISLKHKTWEKRFIFQKEISIKKSNFGF